MLHISFPYEKGTHSTSSPPPIFPVLKGFTP